MVSESLFIKLATFWIALHNNAMHDRARSTVQTMTDYCTYKTIGLYLYTNHYVQLSPIYIPY